MRVDHWERLLLEQTEAARGKPFAWGEHDCATFAADCIEAITGERPAMPAWTSARDAVRVLADEGGAVAAMIARFGSPIPPRIAQRGDVGVMDSDAETGAAFVVCLGDRWAAPGAQGLAFLAVDLVGSAWRID